LSKIKSPFYTFLGVNWAFFLFLTVKDGILYFSSFGKRNADIYKFIGRSLGCNEILYVLAIGIRIEKNTARMIA